MFMYLTVMNMLNHPKNLFRNDGLPAVFLLISSILLIHTCLDIKSLMLMGSSLYKLPGSSSAFSDSLPAIEKGISDP